MRSIFSLLPFLFAFSDYVHPTMQYQNLNSLQCGKNPFYQYRTAGKVVGGDLATLGEWPWMVALYVLNIHSGHVMFRCGGSLIDIYWVLTAAHCIPTRPDERLYIVRLGDLDLDSNVQDGAAPIDKYVAQPAIIHHQYSSEKQLNDIALVRLQDPVIYTDYIRPICIRRGIFAKELNYIGMKPIVIGWGMKHPGDLYLPSHLRQAKLRVMSHGRCKIKYPNLRKAEGTLCARGLGKDACFGDSGGPLMFLESDGSWTLGGIVSFGRGCAQFFYPGVYTKVSSYIDWINMITGLNF